MTDSDFDPMLDCYLSWEACIAEFRRQHQAGEPAKERFAKAHRNQRAASRYAIDRVVPDGRKRSLVHEGWFYVRDTTRPLRHQRISIMFRTRAQAERCRNVLIADDARENAA